jgi:hypothetical protein
LVSNLHSPRKKQMLMTRLLAAICCSLLSIPPMAFCQERAPDGQIYSSLRPFVGLEGVTVQVLGLRGIIYNLPGASEDPAKDATGLSSGELEQLDRAVRDDIATAFREQSVPLLEGARVPADTSPRLEVSIHWMRIKEDTTVIDVTTRFREPARLIKDPSKIVWADTWGPEHASYPTSPESLVKDVRRIALGGVHDFLQLYVRAHARQR